MQTAWTPQPDELAALNAGGNVIVQLLAPQHPPIAVFVGDPPEGETMPKPTFDAAMVATCVQAAASHAALTNKKGRERHVGVVIAILKAAGMVEAP